MKRALAIAACLGALACAGATRYHTAQVPYKAPPAAAGGWTPSYALQFNLGASTEYTKTDIRPSGHASLRMLYQFRAFASGANAVGVGTTNKRMMWGSNGLGVSWTCRWGSTVTNTTTAANTNWHWVVQDANGLYLDGSLVLDSSGHTLDPDGTQEFYVGMANNNGTAVFYSQINICRYQILDASSNVLQDCQAQSNGSWLNVTTGTNIWKNGGGALNVASVAGISMPAQNWK